MRTIIRVLGANLTLDGGEWAGADARVLGWAAQYAETVYLGLGYNPDPDLALARAVAEGFGGEVVYQSPPPDDDPDTVY